MPQKPSTRRAFLSRAAAACALPALVPASALGRDGAVAPSNRIVMGAIGLGNRGTGDLYIEVTVEVPTKLTKSQKQLFEQLGKDVDVKQCSEMKNYREKMSSMYGVDPY